MASAMESPSTVSGLLGCPLGVGLVEVGCGGGGGEEDEADTVGGGVGKDSAEHAKGELEVKVPVQDDPANGEVVGRFKGMQGRGAK